MYARSSSVGTSGDAGGAVRSGRASSAWAASAGIWATTTLRRSSSTRINRGKGRLERPRRAQGGREPRGDDRGFDPARGQNCRRTNGWSGGIDRYIRGPCAQNAVNRGDGFETLGMPEADAISAADGQAGELVCQLRLRG